MREFTEFEIQNMDYLVSRGLSYVYVLLTKNILSHAIFDANKNIVRYLKEQGIHDYEKQKRGKDFRVLVNTHILTFKEDISSKTSMYKATTRGDKRMWFGSEVLPYTEDDNIFIIIAHKDELFIFNASKIDVELCFNTSQDNPIKRFLKNLVAVKSLS